MQDIIAGKYIDRDSVVHRLDPRAKTALLTGFVAYLIIWPEYIAYLAGSIILLLATILARIPAKTALRFLFGIRFFVLIAFLVHLLFTPGKNGYDWWIFHLSLQGAANGVLYAIRLIELIWAAMLLGWTTAPVSFADGIERIAKPLSKVGVPVRDIATMLLLAMRFLPTLLTDVRELRLAQEARGAKFGSGKFSERIKSIIPLIVPIFMSAFRRADATAVALTVRGYISEGPRTSLYPLKLNSTDAVAIFFSVWLITVAVVNRLVL
ncbi:hypothetical protein DRQ36_03115 [bacterium]|nr:MAG: hypothetical protein DRQ36_03115 [bacterium]